MEGRTRRAVGASLAVFGALAVVPSAQAAAGVSVTSLSALHGSAGTLSGVVTNDTARGVRAPVTVALNRSRMLRKTVGHTTVAVPAHSRVGYRVAVKLPAGLAKGNYYLSACTPFGGPDTGKLGCATSANDLKVKGGTPVRGAKVQLPSLRSLARASAAEDCTPGARTLVKPGDRVYPEAGNGGYKSVHTDVFTVYDAVTNLFLPGTHVDLTQRSTQCLSEFSVDFDAHNTVAGTSSTPSTDMTVQSITINGAPATFTYKQPTYPGDPKGQDDPDPLAHRTGLTIPISASNPNPPACAPQLAGAAGQDQPCLPTKLVITPATPIPSGTDFKVTINYTGRPGIRNQGDGRTEGWFRNNSPAADGAMVTSEPMGTMAWMPLNDHTAVKPTYDIHSTVNYDPALPADQNRVFIGNGRLVSTVVNAPDANYPTGGSRTFNWHSAEPIGAYLVENSVGHFSLTERVATAGDVLYYEAQAANITDTRKASNKVIMDQQEDITHFQEQVNGPFPFNANGIIVAFPSASFEEEMQTKIVFVGGSIGNNAQTFSHENMHQWWGDNVSYSDHRYTFFKEGYADMSEYLFLARNAGLAAGAEGSAAYNAAFEASIASRFNGTGRYGTTSTSFWTVAPANPTSANLFGTANTYTRPGMAYVALRAILGKDNFASASKEIQRDYGGGSISPEQQIVIYKKWLPNRTAGCLKKLDAFFQQWWFTAYNGSPAAGNKPSITGPGLAGGGFYDADGNCSGYVTEVPSTPGGTVPATLSLTLGAPATFGAFVPGVAKDYTASTTATVTSTAADAALTVSPSPAYLANGAFTLPQPLQVSFSKSAWDGPAANEVATITFKQAIGANDALRTGTYSKTLTFTLSTTTP